MEAPVGRCRGFCLEVVRLYVPWPSEWKGSATRPIPGTRGAARYGPPVRFYGVVSEQDVETVEIFAQREDAERFVAEVEDDDPELAALLRVEELEL